MTIKELYEYVKAQGKGNYEIFVYDGYDYELSGKPENHVDFDDERKIIRLV